MFLCSKAANLFFAVISARIHRCDALKAGTSDDKLVFGARVVEEDRAFGLEKWIEALEHRVGG